MRERVTAPLCRALVHGDSHERWLRRAGTEAAENGSCQPGISVFRRDNGRIVRVSDTDMGPGDAFCSVWHFFDMLPGGAGDWAPQFKYR